MINIKAKREKRLDHMALLHIDNTPPYLIQSKFDSMGIHRLRSPPDGPDIAPCDFWRFGSLKLKLEAMFFDTRAVL
jgi:hypothetical protein